LKQFINQFRARFYLNENLNPYPPFTRVPPQA